MKFWPTSESGSSRRRSNSSTSAASRAPRWTTSPPNWATKPFIYTHFRGKVELLAALCKPTIELSLEAVASAAARPGTPTERLRHAITDFTKVVLNRQPNIAIYFREEKNLSPEALAEINALRRQFDHVLSDLLIEGTASGEFEIPDPRRPRPRRHDILGLCLVPPAGV